MHVAGEVGRCGAAVTVEGAVIIYQPQRATAALQHVLEPIAREPISEVDVAWVVGLIVDPRPAARVSTIDPHH